MNAGEVAINEQGHPSSVPSAKPHSPLEGVRVLDFTFLLPGPFCTQILADLGAEVIKVEPPAGDPSREMVSEIFWAANRNKRSVAIDLKRPGGAEICQRLAQKCDVVVEGFRPGVAARLGVGPEQLRATNPRLIYASISGFGQSGPMRDRPGHDINYLASGGALSYSGHWSEPPRRSGIPVADLAGATLCAIAILAALRQRDRTGIGCYIDLALRDAAMFFASVRGGRGLRLRNDRRAHLWPTNELFETADGRILALGVVEQKFWERLVQVLVHREPRLAEPRFATEAGRRIHGDELYRLLSELFRTLPAREWLNLLESSDVPVTEVLTLDEAAYSEQSMARNLLSYKEGEVYVKFPALFDGSAIEVRRSPPALGKDTADVLGELGFSEAEVSELAARGVVFLGDQIGVAGYGRKLAGGKE
jgi:crotonobetainyl-CoA:carnitine CoA-transferase CaiB-like acyl-CoA transferase